jgi:hypothetical protein
MNDEKPADIQAALKRQTPPISQAMATLIAKRNGWRLRTVVMQAALAGIYDQKSKQSDEQAEQAYIEGRTTKARSRPRTDRPLHATQQDLKSSNSIVLWIITPLLVVTVIVVSLWNIMMTSIKNPIIAMTFVLFIALIVVGIKAAFGF